jgi:hypothetical protein
MDANEKVRLLFAYIHFEHDAHIFFSPEVEFCGYR